MRQIAAWRLSSLLARPSILFLSRSARVRRALVLAVAGALGCGRGSGVADAGAGCLPGTVSFTLHVAAGSTTTYCMSARGACSDSWLSILTADGKGSFNLDFGCVPDCSGACQPLTCPTVCVAPQPIGAAGVQRSWDGTYVEHGACGAGIPCAHSLCAPAGSYIAHMCGIPDPPGSSGTCQSQSTPTCTDVPFVWPPPSGASTIEGTIGG